MNLKSKDWMADKLQKLTFVDWDRFTVADWDGEQCVSVYGWIDRETDEYKDFVLVIFWPEFGTVYSTTSSDNYIKEIQRRIHHEDSDHNVCHRVEDEFNITNAIEQVEATR